MKPLLQRLAVFLPVALIIAAGSNASYADDFFLEIEKSCMTTGAGISFKCKPKSERVALFTHGGKWYGRDTSGNDVNVFELKILANDENILVLDYPVIYSGKSIIYIFKKVPRFYWTEFAYSDVFDKEEGTVSSGRFLRVNK